jgi:hypothetical protein
LKLVTPCVLYLNIYTDSSAFTEALHCAQNPGLGHEKRLLTVKNPFKDVLSGKMDFFKPEEWRVEEEVCRKAIMAHS